MIEEIITVVATAATISGVTLKSLRDRSRAQRQDVENYVRFLEGKKVLTVPFEREVLPSVVKSLEKIKDETEMVRAKIRDEYVSLILSHLILKISEELMILHAIDPADPRRDQKMYRSIQEVRSKFAKALALLCESFKINMVGSSLSAMIADMGYKPRRA